MVGRTLKIMFLSIAFIFFSGYQYYFDPDLIESFLLAVAFISFALCILFDNILIKIGLLLLGGSAFLYHRMLYELSQTQVVTLLIVLVAITATAFFKDIDKYLEPRAEEAAEKKASEEPERLRVWKEKHGR
ncbi:hypothetical protein RY280_23440 [Bacillus paralicheniformis]|uniref:hypothetical protein n=1 Tax=Bacillus paralicheniformis TaxID=1648923 RepID=UPI003A8973F2